MPVQFIETAAGRLAVLPEDDYLALAKLAEAVQDAADTAEAKERLRRLDSGEDETLPAEIVHRIVIDGEHPVRVFREWRGMTAAELAKAASVSRVYLTQIETKKRDGTMAVMARIAAALRVTIDDLLPAAAETHDPLPNSEED